MYVNSTELKCVSSSTEIKHKRTPQPKAINGMDKAKLLRDFEIRANQVRSSLHGDQPQRWMTKTTRRQQCRSLKGQQLQNPSERRWTNTKISNWKCKSYPTPKHKQNPWCPRHWHTASPDSLNGRVPLQAQPAPLLQAALPCT